MLKSYLYLNNTADKGKGVFTQERIPKGIVIEESPVIVMEESDRTFLDKTKLHDYIFEWGSGTGKCCMALGWIPMYNHSYASNCEYIMDYEDETITIQTVRVIESGEELTINYNGDWNDETPIWFEAK